jgi:hypothetical protein
MRRDDDYKSFVKRPPAAAHRRRRALRGRRPQPGAAHAPDRGGAQRGQRGAASAGARHRQQRGTSWRARRGDRDARRSTMGRDAVGTAPASGTVVPHRGRGARFRHVLAARRRAAGAVRGAQAPTSQQRGAVQRARRPLPDLCFSQLNNRALPCGMQLTRHRRRVHGPRESESLSALADD